MSDTEPPDEKLCDYAEPTPSLAGVPMNNIQVRESKTGIDVILAAPGIRAFNAYLSFRTAFEELGLDLNELTVQRGGDTVSRLEARLEQDALSSFSLTQENTALSFSGSEEGKFARITVWCAEGGTNECTTRC